MCDGREKDVYRFMKLMADDCEDKQKCSVEISKERFGRKNCKGKVILLKFLKFQLILETFKLRVRYKCTGTDRTEVDEGKGNCIPDVDSYEDSDEDDGTISIITGGGGQCEGNAMVREEEVRCGNILGLACDGGCLR